MSTRRSNSVLLIGIAVFVLGAMLVFFGLRSRDRASGQPAARPQTSQPAVSVVPGQAPVVTLPAGKQAVAIELPSVPGLAGYAKAGDVVNIYATIRNGQPNSALKVPLSKLVLSGVKVLDVRATLPGATGNATYLLALDQSEAEQVIFFAKFESMWLALAKAGQPPVATVGRSYRNAL